MFAYSSEAQADINPIVVDYTGAYATSSVLAAMSGALANGASLRNVADYFANQNYASVIRNYVPGVRPDLLQLAALPITPDDALIL